MKALTTTTEAGDAEILDVVEGDEDLGYRERIDQLPTPRRLPSRGTTPSPSRDAKHLSGPKEEDRGNNAGERQLVSLGDEFAGDAPAAANTAPTVLTTTSAQPAGAGEWSWPQNGLSYKAELRVAHAATRLQSRMRARVARRRFLADLADRKVTRPSAEHITCTHIGAITRNAPSHAHAHVHIAHAHTRSRLGCSPARALMQARLRFFSLPIFFASIFDLIGNTITLNLVDRGDLSRRWVPAPPGGAWMHMHPASPCTWHGTWPQIAHRCLPRDAHARVQVQYARMRTCRRDAATTLGDAMCDRRWSPLCSSQSLACSQSSTTFVGGSASASPLPTAYFW